MPFNDVYGDFVFHDLDLFSIGYISKVNIHDNHENSNRNLTFTIKFEIVLLHVLLIGIYTYDILAYSDNPMFRVSHILPANSTQMVTSCKRHYWHQIGSAIKNAL